MQEIPKKIALITGSSRGIGAAVAKRFASEGIHVILTGRTVGALEEVDDVIRTNGGSASLVPLDLRDYARLDALAAELYQRYGRLDVLVGNAAVLGDLTPITHASDAMWQEVMDVNVTANFRLIRAMDPLLKRSAAGRAMFVTSGVTQREVPKSYWGAYAVSKAALETLVLTYAAECASTSVRVNLIDPGVVRTTMRAKAMPGEDPMTLPRAESITDAFVMLASTECTQHGQRVSV